MRLKKLKTMAAAVALVSTAGAVVAVPTATAQPNERARLFEVTVEITNLAPTYGTNQTPVWVGLHDGTFDLYDRNAPVSPALERLAEDGTNQPLIDLFAASGAGVDTVIASDQGIPPFAPGDTGSFTFLVDAQRGDPQYLSYASMILPSNDAFIANGSPTAHRIFNNRGRFVGRSFVVSGGEVLDAGSEVNDEVPANTAFFGQAAPDTGVVENGTVQLHPGFNAPGTGGILDAAEFAAADFTNYDTIQVDISAERVGRNSRARLTGTDEVPANGSDVRGFTRLRYQADGSIDYRVVARRIDNVTAAHIHLGAPGENGEVVAVLLSEPFNRRTLRLNGALTDADLVGSLAGGSTLDLWQMVQNGEAYVNVHTTDYPGGEARANLN